GHDDAGWDVGQAHRGIRGVYRLPARTGGAVDVHADVRIRHLDGVRLLHDGQDLHLGEAGLAAPLVIEGADAHQAVGALLNREGAVHVITVDDEGRGLNTRLLRIGDVVDIRLVAVLFGPAGVHAQLHLRPVRGIHATGA